MNNCSVPLIEALALRYIAVRHPEQKVKSLAMVPRLDAGDLHA